jgi:C1A family cysteine protease
MLVSLLVALASATPQQEAFKRFLQEYHKSYTNASEYEYRLSVFSDNLVRINKQNEEHTLVSGAAVFGVTQFSDLTEQEFKSRYLTAVPQPTVGEVVTFEGETAAEIDWRTKDVLTRVKDQGQCGSCWAFSATEAIESFAKLANRALIELAPQQITSCDKTDAGCNGGWPYNAYNYVKSAGGIESEGAYPYTSGSTGKTGNCNFDSGKVAISLNGYKSVATGENNLEAALNVGPVSVCVDANSWGSYRGGILSTCGTSVDHCVQAVGYTSDYWVIRNSWGTSWGENGFMRIARGRNLCLISSYVTYPTFA